MLTFDDLRDYEIPDVLPLDVTPTWQRLLLGRPLWRFRHLTEEVWVYVTDAQYRRIFRTHTGVW